MLLAGPVEGESLSGIDLHSSLVADMASYQLGGAVSRAALPPASLAIPEAEVPRLRVSVPRLIRETSETVRQTALGGVRIYFGEAWNEGADVFQLGTALTRGQTTAGLSVTYEDDAQVLSSSELYLNYAVTEQFSVRISGILSDDLTEDASRLPQLGLNAELSTEGGTFLQGAIADTRSTEPVFGLAIGLRF